MKKILLISLYTALLSSLAPLKAQQIPLNNFYLQNPYLFNSATTGLNGNLTAFLNYSDQWTGLKSAPESATAGLHGLVTKSMGLGVNFSFQRFGIFNQSSADLKYSYRVAFQKNHTLAFGISLGVLQNKINYDKVDIPNISDPALYSNKFNESLFRGGIGLHYNRQALDIHISAPEIYGTQENKFLQNGFALVSYKFQTAGDVWEITPSLFYGYSGNNLHRADINLTAEWYGRVWFQLGYRTNNNILAAVGINIKDINIGYAFELNRTHLNTVSAGTNQIMISFETPYSVSKSRPLYRKTNRNAWN